MSPRTISQLGVLAMAVVLALAACSTSGASADHSTPTATPATVPAATSTSAAATATPTAGYPVRVFFSKHPESDNAVTAVFPVGRVSPTLGVATYATQQLIAGPTASEATAGYFTPLPGALSGASNCGGSDFQLALDMKGATPETGTATLRFCRATMLPGDLAGGYITAEITATLMQFPNIHKVVILNSAGSCFDDLSGMNACLK